MYNDVKPIKTVLFVNNDNCTKNDMTALLNLDFKSKLLFLSKDPLTDTILFSQAERYNGIQLLLKGIHWCKNWTDSLTNK